MRNDSVTGQKTARGGNLASCDTHCLITILATLIIAHTNNLVSLLILLHTYLRPCLVLSSGHGVLPLPDPLAAMNSCGLMLLLLCFSFSLST